MQAKEAAGPLRKAYTAFWDWYMPVAFRFYKDRFNRTDKVYHYRYPSPGNELVENANEFPRNFRETYQHSINNVRLGFDFSDFEQNKSGHICIYRPGTEDEELVGHGLITKSELADPAKKEAARKIYLDVMGEFPTEPIVDIKNPKEMEAQVPFNFHSATVPRHGDTETKRAAIREAILKSHQSIVEETANNRSQVDYYNPKGVTFWHSWDMTAIMPDWRQSRIDSQITFDKLIEERTEAGSMPVLMGNPRKNWQVLDDSFSEENHIKAQSAIKDDMTVTTLLPNETTRSMGQIRRSDLLGELDLEDASISYPIKTEYLS